MRKQPEFERNEKGFAVPTPPTVSVIIPTYNRKALLGETLDSLALQTYPSDHVEVIIVDDGSTDGTSEIAAQAFPFVLRYVWQRNQGDATARNLGARHSQAEILVFLDDDIVAEADYLTHITEALGTDQSRIVAGMSILCPAETTLFSQSLHSLPTSDHLHAVTKIPFTDVYSNNMAIGREDYFKIGMMQGLEFPGSSMWCDLDFNYRAYRQGYKFYYCHKALCWHRDYAAGSLDVNKKRMRTAAYRAVVLFQRHPELLDHIPMFYDKIPISWGQDSPRLIARKAARAVVSSRPALWVMEKIVNMLESSIPASKLLPSLYRYIIGGYVFQGYREGLNEFGQIKKVGEPVRLP